MKSVGKLHSLWIILKTVGITVYFSSICIYQCYRKKPLDEINHTIRNWAKGMLSPIQLSYKIYDPYAVTLKTHRPIEFQGDGSRAYILMSNHTSLYDIPLIFMALPGNIRMIAKKELFKIPIWGHAMKASEFIAIDRKNSAQAIEDLNLAKKQMEEDGIIPWVAPEGTRSRSGQLGVFKKGGFMLALQTNAIIIPIGIRGAGKILPPDTLNFSVNETVEVHIGKPIDSTQYTVETRKELLRVVRESIKEAAGITE